MADTSHLVALQERLSRERSRLASATSVKDKVFRTVQVAQTEKEIAGELAFLGMTADTLPEMSDDELMAELMA